MKRMFFALLFFVTVFTAVANAQRFGNTTCRLVPGPCIERAIRRGYAPVDYMLNNYGYGNGRIVTALVAGAVGGLVVDVISHRRDNRERGYVPFPDGGRYYAESQRREVVFAAPKPQKPLDCRKPPGKRGRNEAACAAAEAEFDAQNEAIKHQACLDRLAASTWFIRNGSAIYTAFPTVNGQPLTICGELVVLRPHQTNNIFPPGDKDRVSGKMYGAVDNNWTGKRVELPARVRAVNRPVAGSNGFVLLAPCEPDKPCLAGEGN